MSNLTKTGYFLNFSYFYYPTKKANFHYIPNNLGNDVDNVSKIDIIKMIGGGRKHRRNCKILPFGRLTRTLRV